VTPEPRPILAVSGPPVLALQESGGWIGVSIAGEPVAWERVARGSGGRSHVPAKTRRAKDLIAGAVTTCWAGITPEPVARIALRLTFYLREPRRKDFDNLTKLVADALTGLIWADDAQVDEALIRKRLDAKAPRTEIVWRVIGTGKEAEIYG
jgi:Holliday junction resolvase RusA-like endonuclease